jgi:hypothetical protein
MSKSYLTVAHCAIEVKSDSVEKKLNIESAMLAGKVVAEAGAIDNRTPAPFSLLPLWRVRSREFAGENGNEKN